MLGFASDQGQLLDIDWMPESTRLGGPALAVVSQTDNARVLLCALPSYNPHRRDYYESSNAELRGGSGMDRTSGKYSPQMQEAIRRRATELYQSGGATEGHDLQNWYQAEAEIVRELSLHPTRCAVVVNVNGVVYTGEYESASADGYTAGEWKAGDPVPVRLAGDKLYLRRPNGRELETNVVKRIG
jgi:hypothetical protein